MKQIALIVALCVASGAGTALAKEPEERISFSEHVAPIFFEHCVSCHRPGEIGPFSMLNYQAVRPWAKSIEKAVAARTMPPWHADSSKTEFLNDRSLSKEEIDTILAWVKQGARPGKATHMPEPPAHNMEWSMGEPDLIFEAETDFTIPAGDENIDYLGVHFKTDLDADIYVSEWELRPKYRASVHHANLMYSPTKLKVVGIGQAVASGGDYIGSYLPGARPFAYPEGTALRIPKGSYIAVQVHYIGGEEEVTDHFRFGVKFAKHRVDKRIRTLGTDDYDISIEPYDKDWQLDTEVTIIQDLTLLSSGAHMHLRGKSYIMSTIFPDGTTKLIADVPRYDFNWQTNYQLAHPVEVPKGTKFHVEAHWDNSEKNPNNPDPSQKVVYGKWTENEMLTTWSHVVLTHEKLGLKIENGRAVGRFDDAVDSAHPFILQSYPNTMQRVLRRRTNDTD